MSRFSASMMIFITVRVTIMVSYVLITPPPFQQGLEASALVIGALRVSTQFYIIIISFKFQLKKTLGHINFSTNSKLDFIFVDFCAIFKFQPFLKARQM